MTWFLTPDRIDGLQERVERLLANPDLQREALRRGHAEHLARARHNRGLLEHFVSSLPGVEPAGLAQEQGDAAWVA